MAAPDPLPPLLAAALGAHFERTRTTFQPLQARGLEAVVLGGGYGRGEGGVRADPGQPPRLHNDLDYFLFARRPGDRPLRAALGRWEAEESRRLGIDVEGQCLAPGRVDRSGRSMMFTDLLAGHQVILGPPDYLTRGAPPPDPSRVAAAEATRLLWNRGTGLLFARADLAAPPAPAASGPGLDDVIHRNQAKARLALGDALLVLHGRHRPLVRERAEEVARLPGLDPALARLHREGTAYKLHPDAAPPRAALAAAQGPLTDLWRRTFLEVEGRRLGRTFADARAYAAYPGRLHPEGSAARHLALAARDALRRGGFLRPARDYPRGALQRALVLLLEPEPALAAAARHLGGPCPDLAAARARYARWWRFYS